MKLKKTIAVVLFLLLASTLFAADMQEKRKGFIQKLIKNGIFQKVETPGSLPHLWVKPAFYALSYDDKSSFVSVVYAYYVTIDKSYNLVILYDHRSGKKIGVYGEKYGGLKLY
jgi:hypothetical protein